MKLQICAVLFFTGLILITAAPVKEKKTVESKKYKKRELIGFGFSNGNGYNEIKPTGLALGTGGPNLGFNRGHGNGPIDLGHEIGNEFGNGDDECELPAKTITVQKTIKIPVPVPVEKKVPVPVPVRIVVPVEKPYPVPVIKPYPVPVEKPVPYPVEKKVPYLVQVPVKVPVPQPVVVPVVQPVPYPVDKLIPYPVKVPIVLKEKGPFYIKDNHNSQSRGLDDFGVDYENGLERQEYIGGGFGDGQDGYGKDSFNIHH